LNALKVKNHIVLNFTKVLDEIIPGEDDENGDGEATDRNYWINRGSKESVELADACQEIINEFYPALTLKYNKYYIGLADQSKAKNFVIFRAKKHFLRVEVKIEDQSPWKERLEEADLVTLSGTKKRGRIIFRLEKEKIQQQRALLKDLFQASYQEYQN